MTEANVTPKEIIAGAINLLETKGWTQGVYARDEDGREVSFSDERATCFCTMGAMKAAERLLRNESEGVVLYSDVYGDAYAAVLKTAQIDYVPTWNDAEGRTKETVIETLKQALEIV